MIDVASNLQSVINSHLQQLNQPGLVTKEAVVGSGLNQIGGTGKTPPAPPKNAISPALAGLMDSVKGLMTEKPAQDTEVLLVQILASMKDAETASQKDKVKLDQEGKKAQLEEKSKKLEESAKKLQEALDKKHSNNIFDKIKLAFEWLGAILAAATAAILIATGVGAVVGGLLLAAAVTSIVMAMSDTVQQITKDLGLNDGQGFGIAGGLTFLAMKAEGKDASEIKKAVQKADMGFMIGLTVLTVVFSLGAAGAGMANGIRAGVQAGVNAAQGAEKAISTATSISSKIAELAKGIKDVLQSAWKAAKAAGDVAEEVASTVMRGAKIAGKVVEAGSAATQIATAGVSVAQGVNTYQATVLESDAKKLNAEAKTMEALMSQLDDMIDQALQRLMAASNRFNDMLDMVVETINDKANTAASMKFRA